jgi:hypothetical protein
MHPAPPHPNIASGSSNQRRSRHINGGDAGNVKLGPSGRRGQSYLPPRPLLFKCQHGNSISGCRAISSNRWSWPPVGLGV